MRLNGLVWLLLFVTPSWAEFPYPTNPQPCNNLPGSSDCIPAENFAAYLFLPAEDPPKVPNDFTGATLWKLGSGSTGFAEIDRNPQELYGVTGASVDRAWQLTTGRPDVIIAVLDSGIRWQHKLPDLVNKFYLNRGELPVPERSENSRDPWDRNRDGVFNIRDYEASGGFSQDSRVRDENHNGALDPEDLIFLFSDGVDGDSNGYTDDISGWDFFEDDNDPVDEVEHGHGTGEATDSAAEANNGGAVGTCPNCMVLMVRVADSFIAEVNAFGRGVLFAVDSGATVIQEALGTLNHSSFGQAAIDYAHKRGVVVIASAADEEAAHHNFPAAYERTVVVNSVTRFASVGETAMSPPSYLYLNGCTNYGPHIALAVPSTSCSSEATGLSAGIAALVYSAARNEIDRGRLQRYRLDDGSYAPFALSANEVKQLLIGSADDVNFDALPEIGLPQNYSVQFNLPGGYRSERFPSIAGFDQYFGYGRINAYRAVQMVHQGRIPPEASLDKPRWFSVVSPEQEVLEVRGRVAANRAESFSWQVSVAPGVQPREEEFTVVSQGYETRPRSGTLALIPLKDLASRMPHGVEGPPTTDNGQPDPDRFTVTVRLRVRDDQGNTGEDRRAWFLHRDVSLRFGTPRLLGSDGAASPVFADLTGDGVDDLIVATSDGAVHVFTGPELVEAPGWPAYTLPMEVQRNSPAFRSGEVPVPRNPILSSPAVGDLDRDGLPEVVATDIYGYLYVWDHRGQLRPGFPVTTRPEFSFAWRSERETAVTPSFVPDKTHRLDADNRLARGFIAGPALGNLDSSADDSLEIVAAAMDRHVYAWFRTGEPVAGWPVLIKDPSKVASVDTTNNTVRLQPNSSRRMGTKIVAAPSIGDVNADGRLDVVVGVNEAYRERPNATITNLLVNFLQITGALDSGNGRIYAIDAEGTRRGPDPVAFGWNPSAFLPGWPVRVAMLTTELLPTVGTGINGPPALADIDGDGAVEVAAFSMLGPAYVFRGNGESFLGYERGTVPRTFPSDPFAAGSNSIDSPAYPALGAPVMAEMFGPGQGFQLLAPTAGLGKLLDSNLPARQFPAENQLTVWDVSSTDQQVINSRFRQGFPHVVNDLQFFVAPAVADITGDGVAEAIWGTGTYDLHAVDANGVEADGWPKFTGGWSIGSPAVGDVDGDGLLEVAAVTREGLLFLYATGGNACGHIPWRQYHHDEWGTGNYHTDARPPAALLASIVRVKDRTVILAGTGVPGDDQFCGKPADVELRGSPDPILDHASFQQATRLEVSAIGAKEAGRSAPFEIHARVPESLSGAVYIAGRTIDDVGNLSPVIPYGAAIFAETSTPTSTSTPDPTPAPTHQRLNGEDGHGCHVSATSKVASLPYVMFIALVAYCCVRRARRS